MEKPTGCQQQTARAAGEFMMAIMMMIIPGSSVGKQSVCNAGGPNSIPG